MSSKIVVNCHFFSFAPKKKKGKERKKRKEVMQSSFAHTKKCHAMHSKLNSINLDWRLLGARDCLLKLPFVTERDVICVE